MRFNKVFWRHTGKSILWSAGLTALVVFFTSLAVNIQNAVEITRLTLVSAGLSALAAFFQAVLEVYRKK
ncbi:MAG: hypothetical protein ACE5NG_15980 [bacterium]